MRKPVWLDCDPGHDDALAIIHAGYSPHIELLGISTVAANQSVEKVTKNALEVLSACGLDEIGVYQGQDKPLLRPGLQCPGKSLISLSRPTATEQEHEIHGTTGLALRQGALPPTALKPQPGKAVIAMAQDIQAFSHIREQKVNLVCTGALTNIALLLIMFPEVGSFIEQIVLMGGAVGSGNTNPCAEFNMQVDPEAAKVVFESGLPVVMVPLEVTHTALATPKVLESIVTDEPTPFLLLVKEIILYFSDTYRSVFSFKDPPIHDPCAVYYVAQPQHFKVEKMRVDIETVSPLTAGQTVCDIYHMSHLPKNVGVAKEMDAQAFWKAQIAAIHRANSASPMRT